jgi:hypothetical protein
LGSATVSVALVGVSPTRLFLDFNFCWSVLINICISSFPSFAWCSNFQSYPVNFHSSVHRFRHQTKLTFVRFVNNPFLVRAFFLFLLTALSLCPARNAAADDWPQWLGPQRDSVWREDGILTSFPPGGPPVIWRAEVGGGYSGPCVAQGKVFVIDRQLSTNAANPNDPFARGRIPGVERVTCFDAATGHQLWRFQYDCPYTVSYPAGPRATPLAADGKVFTLGAEGNLYCLNAATGAVLWSRDFKKDYNIPTPM